MSDMFLDALNGEPLGQDCLHQADLPGRRTARPTAGLAVVETAAPRDDGLEAFLASAENRAYRLARIALWDHELALDIVQDSMLRLVEHYRDKPQSEWPALFFTILRNRINDARRHRRIQERVASFIPLFGRRPDPESQEEVDLLEFGLGVNGDRHDGDPESEMNAQRIRQSIESAVLSLPERQRQVFLLREGQELSIRETSQILGCSEGAVKQHHFRAMQTLRHLLAEVWEHE
ncbi:MAG: RNA polymerase sigma factor [Gammaproteobacteria bacterium]|nr:RNA polymerase sigma factor [Gammaproteobacteria bacterium]